LGIAVSITKIAFSTEVCSIVFQRVQSEGMPSQVVAPGKERCPTLTSDVEGAFCIRMETGNIAPGSMGGPVIVLDLPPGLKMDKGDPHIDMVVGVLSGVDHFPAEGGRAGCVAEISRHADWIEEVVTQRCMVQLG